MTELKRIISIAACAAFLSACGSSSTDDADKVAEPAGNSATDAPSLSPVEAAIAGEWRSAENVARDVWRNPAETLAFFDIDGDETVMEIWPGGGWYTEVIAPALKAGGGTYVAAGFDRERSDFARRGMERFESVFVQNPDVYGSVEVVTLSGEGISPLEAGSVDTVLTFRNVHNWMSGGYADKVFEDMFTVLKPGGTLGVVEHRLASAYLQDPKAGNGYVHEDFVKALAVEAGFEFVEASEINANPKDTKDHPFGVWTLPPRSRTQDREGNTPEGFDPAVYVEIGESDRMTLKFRKPE